MSLRRRERWQTRGETGSGTPWRPSCGDADTPRAGLRPPRGGRPQAPRTLGQACRLVYMAGAGGSGTVYRRDRILLPPRASMCVGEPARRGRGGGDDPGTPHPGAAPNQGPTARGRVVGPGCTWSPSGGAPDRAHWPYGLAVAAETSRLAVMATAAARSSKATIAADPTSGRSSAFRPRSAPTAPRGAKIPTVHRKAVPCGAAAATANGAAAARSMAMSGHSWSTTASPEAV